MPQFLCTVQTCIYWISFVSLTGSLHSANLKHGRTYCLLHDLKGWQMFCCLSIFTRGWVVLLLSWGRPNRTPWRTSQVWIMSLTRSSSATPVSWPRSSSASCWRRTRSKSHCSFTAGKPKVQLCFHHSCTSKTSLTWLRVSLYKQHCEQPNNNWTQKIFIWLQQHWGHFQFFEAIENCELEHNNTILPAVLKSFSSSDVLKQKVAY